MLRHTASCSLEPTGYKSVQRSCVSVRLPIAWFKELEGGGVGHLFISSVGLLMSNLASVLLSEAGP